jgi:hypothetical protein
MPFPRQNEHLRHFFYPKGDMSYYEHNPSKKEYASANPNVFDPLGERDEMQRLWGIKKNFRYRRQHFLKNHSDRQLFSVYSILTSPEGADLRVWTWEDLKRLLDQGTAIADDIFHHICFWYEPLYEPEKRNKGDEKVFSWIQSCMRSSLRQATCLRQCRW